MKTSPPSKKIRFILYEILRLLFILTYRPEFDIDMLPASWYMATPLLILPLILVFFMYQASSQEERKTYSRIFAYSKFLSVAGFFPFMRVALLPAFEQSQFTGYYSLKRMGILLIFLLIDVILALIILLQKEEKSMEEEKNHADNSDS